MTKKVAVTRLLPVDQVPPFTTAEAAAVKALSIGQAVEHQQRLAFDWIFKHAAGIATQSYRPDPYATHFAEGRRFVALCIQILLEQKATQNG